MRHRVSKSEFHNQAPDGCEIGEYDDDPPCPEDFEDRSMDEDNQLVAEEV